MGSECTLIHRDRAVAEDAQTLVLLLLLLTTTMMMKKMKKRMELVGNCGRRTADRRYSVCRLQ